MQKGIFGFFAIGFLLGALTVGAIGWTVWTDSERANAERIGQLESTNQRLTDDQRQSDQLIGRSKEILGSAVGTIAKLRQLVELYFPGK